MSVTAKIKSQLTRNIITNDEDSQLYKPQLLHLSWSTSVDNAAERYSTCQLDDYERQQRFQCFGTDYDMAATLLGEFLQKNYQTQLLSIRCNAFHILGAAFKLVKNVGDTRYFGMIHDSIGGSRILLDGRTAGRDCMIEIGAAIGLKIEPYVVDGKVAGFLFNGK